MQIHEPVYENDLETAAIQGVKRRPPERNFRNRLKQIVSLYVPNPPAQLDDSGHAGLLAYEQCVGDFEESSERKPYVLKQLYSWKPLVNSICETIGVSATITTSDDHHREIVAIAADEHAIYVGLTDLPYVFVLKPADSTGTNEQTSNTESTLSMIKGHIRLHISKIGDLYPQEICVYSPTDDSTVLYIVGWIRTENVTENEPVGTRKWLLAKFSLEGRPLSLSPLYDYQRYSGLVVDTVDGKLLLTCPVMTDLSKWPIPDAKTMEQSAGQICKLTPNFERRVFSVTLGSEQVVYRPEYVSQLSAGGCCWASVMKLAHIGSTEETMKTTRRLFAFPTNQPSGKEKQSPREWLHLSSWDFADLTPGRIAAFDERRLLVLDQANGTLSYITWIGEQSPSPSLHRITRPGSNRIDLLCSSYTAQPRDQAQQKEVDIAVVTRVAYFVSQSSIYMFTFNDQTH